MQSDIRVIGVGGGGVLMINYMIEAGLPGVDFVVMDSDIHSLETSNADTSVVLGVTRLKGLGAGSSVKAVKSAAEESRDDIRDCIHGADIVFIVAGMGGGTGTGAAPVIASIAKEHSIYTVAVVSESFPFEGRKRATQADEGMKKLEGQVDTLIKVSWRQVLSARADGPSSIAEAFRLVCSICYQGVRTISDMLVFRESTKLSVPDIRATMTNTGCGLIGVGESSGTDRALDAVGKALASLSLAESLGRADRVLLNVTSGSRLETSEMEDVVKVVRATMNRNGHITYGHVCDQQMDRDTLRVSLIAAEEWFEEEPVPVVEVMPLNQAKFTGEVCGLYGKFSLQLAFRNPAQESVELVYTFPLPHDAAVTGFRARLGEETVVSRILPREEAFSVYEKALAAGDSGVLVERERPNVFTLTLGRLGAEESAEIVIDYSMPIPMNEREMRIMFPTVVAPRYIPGLPIGGRTGSGVSFPTTLVSDADFVTPSVAGDGYPLDLDIQLTPPASVQAVRSPSHTITAEPSGVDSWRVSLTDAKTDRDIVILAELEAGTFVRSLVDSPERPEYIQVIFTPEIPSPNSVPRDYLFLLDISGSMTGQKLEQAKMAIELCLRNLDQGDWFDIIAFESTTHVFSGDVVRYDSQSLRAAVDWLRNIEAIGGTEILEPIRQALFRKGIRERAVFLVTDGQVGNEAQVISYIHDHIGDAALFTVGIDTAVNAYFIQEAAMAGNGQAELVHLGERIEDKVMRQFARAGTPRVTDLKIDWGGLEVAEVYPPVLARVRAYDEQPLTVVARVASGRPGSITLTGLVGSAAFQTEAAECVAVDPSILAQQWARQAIREAENNIARANPRRHSSMIERIQTLSQDCGVLSNHTALIACIERKEKDGVEPRYISLPVAKPHGWVLPSRSVGDSFLSSEGDLDIPTYDIPTFLPKRKRGVARERLGMVLPTAQEAPAPDSHQASDQDHSDQDLQQLALLTDADGTVGRDSCPALQAICMLAFLKNKHVLQYYRRLVRKGASVLAKMMRQEELSDHQCFLVLLALKGAAACSIWQEATPDASVTTAEYREVLAQDWPGALDVAVSQGLLETTVADQESYRLALQILSK